jgi:DNA polymerase-3 subunit epsilon
MFSIIDVETTGGSSRRDKITEIAIYIHDGKKVVDTYSTLITPERTIPYFITSLTGIDDKMVKDAPKFYEVAQKIVEFTNNTVFIAHNVGFDYGFVREEFKSLGFDFKRKKLCTVQLSRKLLPGMGSYSLGKLCENLNIVINGRHRAAGDALATVKLFEMLIKRDANNLIKKHFKNDLLSFSVPSNITNELINPLPEETGVYYFFDDEDNLIYIGKSNNIRSRVISHFNNNQTKKAVDMKQRIKRIDYELTGSELIALLKESEEIKQRLPIYNRAQRRSLFNYGIFVDLELDGYIHLKAKKIAKNQMPVITYFSLAEAKENLRKLCDEYELCLKLCGLYPTESSCFYYQIERCHGACIGEESPDDYNQRVNEALNKFKFEDHSFIIIDRGRFINENCVVLVRSGKYLGYGYFDSNDIEITETTVDQFITSKADNKDTRQIIRGYLKKNKVGRLIRF